MRAVGCLILSVALFFWQIMESWSMLGLLLVSRIPAV